MSCMPPALRGPVGFATLFVLGVFSPYARAVSFAPAVSHELAETSPVDIVVADFNADGTADMAVSLSGEAGGVGGVSILAGDGAGGFPAQSQLGATDRDGLGYAPAGLDAGDFDGDGNLDLAVAAGGADSRDVHLYRGDGNGAFTYLGTLTSGGQSPWSVVAADFTGDLDVDLAVGNSGGTGYGVSLFKGNGDGTFSTAQNLPATSSVRATAMDAADFDHDGDRDLALPTMVLLNDGTGQFARSANIGLSGAVGVAAVDLDNDSWVDVAVANTGTIDIWRNNGDGSFSFVNGYPQAAGRLTGMAAVDLDRDGGVDVIAADQDANAVRVFPGDGMGGLGVPQSFTTDIQPQAVAGADWNGDGFGDIAAACRNNGDTPFVSVLLQVPGGTDPGGTDPGGTDPGGTDPGGTDAAGSVQLGVASYSVREDAGSAQISVTRSGGTLGAASVDYATSDGSATAGSDYTASAGTLTFADGELGQAFNVAIMNDAVFEGDETFTVTLSNVSASMVPGSPLTATVTITDDDAPPGDSNGDGISDADAVRLDLVPNAPGGDSDGDGLADVIEVGGDVTSPLDSDADGVIDALESGVSASNAGTADGLRLAGGASLTITTAAGEMLSRVSAAAATHAPADVSFPFGTVSYQTSCAVVGGSVTVRLEFSTDLPAGLTLYKVDAAGVFARLPASRWQRVNRRTLDIVLTDGEALTDMDGVANGYISDPLAVGAASPAVSVSASGGGGGCALQARPGAPGALPLLPLVWLAFLLRNCVVRRQGRGRKPVAPAAGSKSDVPWY